MILLDTHTVIWWQSESPRLPARTRDRIETADRVVVSAVSCWELATLVAKGRVALDRTLAEWLSDMRAAPALHVHPLSPDAAIVAADLEAAGFHPDPADRLLYASALQLGATFVTRDERIRAFSGRAPPRLLVECFWQT